MSEALAEFGITDPRAYVATVIEIHLESTARKVIAAAEARHATTVHTHSFVVAVGATALFVPESRTMPQVAHASLSNQGGLEVVTTAYPWISRWSQVDWQDQLDAAWQLVRYKPDARRPQDRSVLGHIELLEAISKHTASFPYRRSTKT